MRKIDPCQLHGPWRGRAGHGRGGRAGRARRRPPARGVPPAAEMDVFREITQVARAARTTTLQAPPAPQRGFSWFMICWGFLGAGAAARTAASPAGEPRTGLGRLRGRGGSPRPACVPPGTVRSIARPRPGVHVQPLPCAGRQVRHGSARSHGAAGPPQPSMWKSRKDFCLCLLISKKVFFPPAEFFLPF